MKRSIEVVFEAYMDIEIDEPYDSDAVKQTIYDAIGYTGITIGDILDAPGASDL